jgi:hypothetical protein
MKRHHLDPASLLAGLVFVGIAIAYLFGAITELRVDARWVAPIALIGLGSAGLAASMTRARRGDDRDESADL